MEATGPAGGGGGDTGDKDQRGRRPPATWLQAVLQKDAPSAYYDNPKFEEPFVQGLTTVDNDARRALYEKATAELNADPVALWTVQAEEYHAWNSAKFADVHPAGQPMVFFDQVKVL